MKKPATYLLFSFGLVLLQACSANELRPQKTTDSLRGHYISGHEVNSFKPCNQSLVYWLVGSDEMLEQMATQYNHYAVNPYDEVYVEITGDFIDKASDGFAADYDGQIQVDATRNMKKKVASDCK